MTQLQHSLIVCSLVIATASCSSESPRSTTTPTPPAPSTATITGTVSATGGARVANATIRVFDGPNAGRSTQSNASGEFTLDNLTPGNANVTANATIYEEVVLGAYLSGPVTMNFIFPVPACQSGNTAQISFGNRSATATHRVVWDGVNIGTIPPGQNIGPITAAAGIPHTLGFFVGTTNTPACSAASPVLTQCDRGRTITCSGP
ncbi:MAG TPA: carboxypeptidase-like regulatory domain-containing protein [Vicinamibacterales bacterium]